MIDKSELLKKLNLEKVNKGTSSGVNWINSEGDNRSIYSPVDGNKIADVVETDKKTYEKIVEIANIHSQGRIISFLEGGYDLVALSESIKEHFFGLSEI